jgi:peptidoglycan/LPS O-acetylase OafA/YrhL
MRRENNFDLIRLGLAWIVVLTHCHDLSLTPVFHHLLPLMQSGRAVDAFFAISGCLIVASWDRTRSTKEYFLRRGKRILPAYWLALLFCLALGGTMTNLQLPAFCKSPDTWKYLLWNVLFLNYKHPDLPGVFSSNPAYSAMDGALWTIKLEVAFYLFVPFLVWAVRRFGAALILSSVFLASVAYRLALEHSGRSALGTQLPGQLCFFIAGSAVYYYFQEFNENRSKVWVFTLLLMLAAFWTNWFVLDAIAIPMFTMAVAFLLPAYRGVTRYGDFSYGTYVLHFPIIQTFVAVGLFARFPWTALGLVFLCVSMASVISWFGVERHFLRPIRVRQREGDLVGQVAVQALS